MLSSEKIDASIKEIQSLAVNIEAKEIRLETRKDDLKDAEVHIRKGEQEIRGLKDGHRQTLGQFQDDLFQDMAHPMNYLAGEPALEYVDYILRSAGKDFMDESMQSASALAKIALPNEEMQPVYFGGQLGGGREPLIALFQGNNTASSWLTIENYSPGILTFATEIHNPAAIFSRREGPYKEWRAGSPHIKNNLVRIDMSASALTITDDPERTVQLIWKEDQAIGESIIAIGSEAVSAAIGNSRDAESSYTGSTGELSDNLMKHVLAKILDQPIGGKSLDVHALCEAYYQRVTDAVGGTYNFRDKKDLPLLLHGDIFSDISSGLFDQQRFEEAVADGLDNSNSANSQGRAGVQKLVEDNFWNLYSSRGSIDEACGVVGEKIINSIATNDIIRGIGSRSIILGNVLDLTSLGVPVKSEVANEALRQSDASYEWNDCLFSKRRKLRRYKKTLDKQVDTP